MNLKDSNNNVKCNLMAASSVQYNQNSKSQILASCSRPVLTCAPVCSGCSKPIIDQYLHNILDKYWHIQCLRCTDCDKQLSGRCFEKDGQIFCAIDYKRRVYTKCSLCLNIILPNELVRHSKDSLVFHLKCFFCVVCQRQLSTGEEYCLLENFRPVCKEDFQNIFKEISEITERNCDNSMKLESETPKEEIRLKELEKDIINTQSISNKDVEIFKEETLNHPKCTFSTTSIIKEITKFPFVDIPSFQPPNIQRSFSNPEQLPCKQILKVRPLKLENISVENIPLEHSSEGMDEPERCDINSQDQDNKPIDPQHLLQEQPDNFLIIANTYDKDHEVCSLDDDLKSSFSAASSPESIIREEEQDGNVSDQTFQDDQQSLCHTESREGAQSGNSGTKRRGPRTTIKAKQLDTLKAAFAATPKPTRHVREQLAQDTGLTMRVIQVWFQNRRSKERRMKQLSAMGARRPFFRNARRMRSLSRGFGPEDMVGDGGQMMNNPPYHGYFGDNPDFCNAIATLGGTFPSVNNYPLGHPAIHREFFMSNSNPCLQQPFINLNQPTSLQNTIQLPSSESNQSIMVSGQLENGFNSNDHFTSTHCNSPEIQFSQPNFNTISQHNLLPGPGYLCRPQITSAGINRPLSIQNLSSLNFVQTPMIGMETW